VQSPTFGLPQAAWFRSGESVQSNQISCAECQMLREQHERMVRDYGAILSELCHKAATLPEKEYQLLRTAACDAHRAVRDGVAAVTRHRVSSECEQIKNLQAKPERMPRGQALGMAQRSVCPDTIETQFVKRSSARNGTEKKPS